MTLKKPFLFLILSAAMIFMIQCAGVQIPKNKQSYVGVWETPRNSPTYMFLSISSNGQVKYERVDAGRSSSITAPITEWNGNNFKAGVLKLSTEFIVNKTPYKSGGNWYMTVDGVNLKRKNF